MFSDAQGAAASVLRLLGVTGAVGRRSVLAMLAALIVLYVAFASSRGIKNPRKKAVEGSKPRRKANNALYSIWSLLCPNLSQLELSGGGWQVFAILVLSVTRIWLMNAHSKAVRRLDVNAMTRDQKEFWLGIREQITVSLFSCLHRQTYKYVESSLAVSWRRKLTDLIQAKYFSKKSYYFLANKAAGEGDQGSAGVVDDPDERVSEDANEVATQLAHVFCEGIYASTAGSFFALKLGQLYGLHFALAPYLYLWSMFALRNIVSPFKVGSWITRCREQFSKYKLGHQLLLTNNEAIAALGGGKFEEETLRSRFAAAQRKAREFHFASLWPNLTESLAYTWVVRSFMATFVVFPHIFLQKKQLDLSTVENIALLKGDIGHQLVLFVQSMISAGATAKMLAQLARITGSAGRVQGMLDVLDATAKAADGASCCPIVDGDSIAFSNVDICTPTGKLLVKDLSFRLPRGTSLLLTGHNGAGKSSIFRCLGGLWKTETGSITKPGGNTGDGLHQTGGVYYLPQKAYNVRGTLVEQMAYPTKGEDLSEDEVQDMLSKVDLLYLYEKYGNQVVNWEEVLSLGEMQRLAIARLLIHKPAFAILDECTSAVSGEMERRLYEVVLKEAKTAYITISHRPVLKAYHDQLLTIGMPRGQYSLVKLNRNEYEGEAARTESTAGQASSSVSSPARTMRKPPTEDGAAQGGFSAFVKLVGQGLPKGKGLRLGLALCAVAAHVGIKVKSTETLGEMTSAVFRRDPKAFISKVGSSLAYAVAGATVEQLTQYLEHDIAEGLMEGLTESFLSRYMEDNTFYNITQLHGKVSDPQVRMTTDFRNFSNATAALVPQLLKPLAELVWFSYSVQRLVGSKAVAYFAAYLVGGAVVIRAAMPKFRQLTAKESALEGVFKLYHSRVKRHAESIAFYGGGQREYAVVNDKFQELMQHVKLRLRENWKFNLINSGVIREAPITAQWLLRNEFSKAMKDEDVLKDQGESLGRVQTFIFDATNQIFDCMGQLLNFAEHLEKLYGVVGRLHELHTEMDAVRAGAMQRHAGTVVRSKDVLGVEGATLETPGKVVLARNLTVKVTPGESLMVTGHTASGKTSLFRVLGELWPLNKGTLFVPEPRSLFLVPQQVFMVLGTFAEQITYPQRMPTDPVERLQIEERLTEIMRVVGLDGLAKIHSWEDELQWEHILSLGEQQRIGMARLFYHKPTFGVLDECTSAVSVDAENKLYSTAQEQGITCITISQRLALTEFHKRELNFGEEHPDNWRLTENKPDSSST